MKATTWNTLLWLCLYILLHIHIIYTGNVPKTKYLQWFSLHGSRSINKSFVKYLQWLSNLRHYTKQAPQHSKEKALVGAFSVIVKSSQIMLEALLSTHFRWVEANWWSIGDWWMNTSKNKSSCLPPFSHLAAAIAHNNLKLNQPKKFPWSFWIKTHTFYVLSNF